MDANGRLILEATVTNVGDGPYYYPACRQCYSKLIVQTTNFCPKCKKVYTDVEVNQRYRVCLTISDGLSLANVTAFGNIFTPFFGCSAEDLHKWHGQFSSQLSSSLLKCALEKSIVGASLLFGFKGIMKKPKGVRVTLRDIRNLGDLPHPARHHSDLIAFQILPQCDLQYPIPVFQHLKTLEYYVQNHKHDIDVCSLDHGYFTHVLSHSTDANRPRTTSHNESMCQDNCKDISGFMLSSAESEASIDLSCTNSTQNTDCFRLSQDDSYMSKSNKTQQEISLIPPEHDEFVNLKESFFLSPLSCKPIQSFIESPTGNNRQSNCKNKLYTTFQLFPSPEQSRETVLKTHFSSTTIPNVSLVEIVPSFSEFDNSHSKCGQNVLISNAMHQINAKESVRTFLTLKSNKNNDNLQSLQNDPVSTSSVEDIIDINSKDGAVFNNTDCKYDKHSETNSNVDMCQLSFAEYPESDDINLFISAAGHSPNRRKPTNVENSQMHIKASDVRQIVTDTCDKPCFSEDDKVNYNFCSKRLTNSYKSFINMPESEDLDLFLAINLEQSSSVDLLKSVEEHNTGDKVSAQRTDEDRGLASKDSSILAFNDSRNTKHTEASAESDIIYSNSTCTMIENTGISDSHEQFNDSCDLFDSPLQSQALSHRTPKIQKYKKMENNQNCLTKGDVLFSSSRKSTDSHYQSQNNDTCMDLFSPTLPFETPHRPRENIINNNRDFSNSSFSHPFCCNSPDLFSSPEMEL